MNLTIFSPHFPPQKCGVGDYTYFLSKALVALGHDVTVLPGRSPGESLPNGDVSFVQYTPQLFPRLGDILSIFRNSSGVRAIGFHELYYPPSWSLRGLVIGVPHWLRFLFLLHVADVAFFSTAGFFGRWSRRLPYLKRKMAWVPVGSNIPVVSVSPNPKESRNLVHFGGAHPTHLYEFLFHTFEKVLEAFPERNYRLVLAGVEKTDVESIFVRFPNLLNSTQVDFLAYCEPEMISHVLGNAELVLAPFLDGVTTRRGSVMSALAHRKLVITTFGDSEDTRACDWKSILAGVDIHATESKRLYAEKVIYWLSRPRDERALMGEKAQNYFEKHFSWGVIAEAILSKVRAFSK